MSTPQERLEEWARDMRETANCLGCFLGLAHDHDYEDDE